MLSHARIHRVVTAVERSGNNGDIQNDRAGRAWSKLAVRLQHGADQCNQAYQRHVRQHHHQELNAKHRRFAHVLNEVQSNLANDGHAGEQHRQQREHQSRELPRGVRVITVQLGVDGKKRGGERALAKQAAEQVGNLEGEVERVHHRASAKDAGQQRVPGEARDTADEGEHREGASVAFESSTHGCARSGRRGYLVSDRCDA